MQPRGKEIEVCTRTNKLSSLAIIFGQCNGREEGKSEREREREN